jgi:hypothetical protein
MANIDKYGRAPYDVNNAYIVWALTSSGITNSTILKELQYLLKLSR